MPTPSDIDTNSVANLCQHANRSSRQAAGSTPVDRMHTQTHFTKRRLNRVCRLRCESQLMPTIPTAASSESDANSHLHLPRRCFEPCRYGDLPSQVDNQAQRSSWCQPSAIPWHPLLVLPKIPRGLGWQHTRSHGNRLGQVKLLQLPLFLHRNLFSILQRMRQVCCVL